MKTILAAALLLWLLAPPPASAQTVATLGEKSIGTACNNGADAVNFDTLAQCSATSGSGTFQKAPLFVGQVTSPPYASTACDAAKAGMLQYTGGVVQYCNGSAWSTMGSSSGTGGQSMVSEWPDAIVCYATISSSSGTRILYLTSAAWSSTSYYYVEAGSAIVSGYYTNAMVYNSDGSFNSMGSAYSANNCNTSIASLVASGKAFNFVNGGANGAAAMADGTAGAPGLYFSADTNTGLYRPTTDTLAIATGGTERLRVTATGSVGIGTTSPARPLSVIGSGSIGQQQLHLGPNSSNGLFLVGSSNSTHYNWLIGEQYNVGDAIEFTPSTAVGGTTFSSPALTIYRSGAATLAGALTQNSDFRLKKDIAPLKNALSKLQAISGVTFYWIEESSDHGQQIGVLAQDIQKAFPQLVREDERGMLTVNYPALVAPLIEAVKELKSENDAIRDEVQAKDAAFSARLEKLEARSK